MPEEDENAQQTEDLRDEEMESGAKKLYLFLCSLTVDMLRLHCRNVHIKSTPVVRASLIARLYKFCFEHVNMQPSDMCKTIEKSKQLLKSFESFCKDWDVHSRKDVPTHSYVMRLGSIDCRADPTALTNLHESLTSRSRITSHARNSSSKKQGAKSRNHGSGSTNGSRDHRGTGSEAPVRPADDANSMKTADPFSISEFARLFLLLVRDIECRDALFKSGKPLSRQKLDRGESNSTFWTSLIEKRFNDSTFACNVDFSVVGDGITPSDPLPEFRSGAKLQTKYNAFRTVFQLPWHKYRQSGQHNPIWKEFLEDSPLRFGDADFERLLVFGLITKIGEPGQSQQFKDFCEFFAKTISAPLGREGERIFEACEGGMTSSEAHNVRKRRPSGSDANASIQQMAETSSKALSHFVNTLDEVRESTRALHADSPAQGVENASAKKMRRSRLIKEKGGMIKEYEEAMRCQKEASDDFASRLWAEQIEDVKESIGELRDELKGQREQE